MNRKRYKNLVLAALPLLTLVAFALMGFRFNENEIRKTSSLVEVVRQATERYKSLEAAEADGYQMFLGCVSGPQGGAMGVHYPNGDLVGDGEINPMHPDVLIYEYQNMKYNLVGVEFLVIAEDWNANHDSPPVLSGHVFNYSGSPNRYGLPAFYELHVWAWKENPNGVFADWNPNVSCESYGTEVVDVSTSTNASQPESVTNTGQKIDIGGGHWLILGPEGGEIVPPSNPVKVQPQASIEDRIYIGYGCTLFYGMNGSRVNC